MPNGTSIKGTADATCTSKVIGRDYSMSSPRGYDFNPHIMMKVIKKTDEYNDVLNNLEQAKETLKKYINKWTPSKGKEIEVIRNGKAADKGDKGIVFFTKVNEFRGVETLKVGYTTSEGITCWTTGNSCIVINPEVKVMEKKPVEEITVKGNVKKMTDKACLCIIDNKQMWVPKSCGKFLYDGSIIVPKWFAEKNGLTSAL